MIYLFIYLFIRLVGLPVREITYLRHGWLSYSYIYLFIYFTEFTDLNSS